MQAKRTEQKGSGKIAAYAAKYSNKSSGAGYRGAVESFLRSVYHLDKQDSEGKKITYNYELLFDQYLDRTKKDAGQDLKDFTEYLKKNSKSQSMQSVRQVLTYAAKFLKSHGITFPEDCTKDIKRETKGGAATVAKELSGKMICDALRGASVRDRAIILTLASSGLRIGELLSLDERDIDLNSNPVKITIRAANAKNKHARFTFCSDEAKDAINAWIKNREAFLKESAKHNQNLIKTVGTVVTDKNKNDKTITTAAVKTDSTLLFPVSDAQINASWEVCLKKAGLYEQSNGRNIYRLHSLRRFFDTRLSNSGMADKLVQYFIGHLSELENKYYVPGEDHARIEYLKVIDCLTCCVPEKAQAKITALEAKTESLEEITQELAGDKKDQRESIEYLRSINKNQQEQIAAMMDSINKLNERMEYIYSGQPFEFPGQFTDEELETGIENPDNKRIRDARLAKLTKQKQ
jgi:site-specific recombinase XerD